MKVGIRAERRGLWQIQERPELEFSKAFLFPQNSLKAMFSDLTGAKPGQRESPFPGCRGGKAEFTEGLCLQSGIETYSTETGKGT